MIRPAEVLALLLAASGVCAFAEDAQKPPIFTHPAPKPAAPTAVTPSRPAPTRTVSTALSAQISAALPSYADASRPAPPPPPPEVPRNRIIRLPAYVVHQARVKNGRSEPFVLSDFYTPAEAERQKMIHYINFDPSRGNPAFVAVWKFLFQGAADAQYEQDQIIARKEEMAGLSELENLHEPAAPPPLPAAHNERAAPSAITPDLSGPK